METTINMHRETYELLTATAKETGINRSCLIKHAVLFYGEDMGDISEDFFTSVSYQNSDLKKNWHKFHITLSPAEYNFFIDLRNLLKLSVSRIVATALEKYLELLVHPELALKDTDNSPVPAYSFQVETGSRPQKHVKWWGIPEKIPD